jgi:hypothetical protein
MQQPWELPRKVSRLHDNSGNHHCGNRHQCRNDAEVNDENGGPSRHTLSQETLSFELVDER